MLTFLHIELVFSTTGYNWSNIFYLAFNAKGYKCQCSMYNFTKFSSQAFLPQNNTLGQT